VEQSHELNLNLRFTLLWPSWLDYRVRTTPCTSRLKTKRLKTLWTYQENIAWIKSSWYYSRNIGGHSWSCPPGPNIGGTCPPCPIGIDAHANQAFCRMYILHSVQGWKKLRFVGKSFNVSRFLRVFYGFNVQGRRDTPFSTSHRFWLSEWRDARTEKSLLK